MNGDKSDGKQLLEGADIAKIMSSTGPIVKCVILRAPANNGHDDDDEEEGKKPSADEKKESADPTTNTKEKKKVLVDLMEELELDTTPSKSMVSKTLGGPFTFLGQYEDEGVVLMVRNIDSNGALEEAELSSQKLSELRNLCKERNVSIEGMLEKSDLIQALVKDSQLPPINPHSLQPPLHKALVRGDILVLKVAATEEELDKSDNDDNGDDNDEKDNEKKDINVLSNEEFFLDYTKEEYIQFASRTDIEEHEIKVPEEQEEDNGEEEQDDDDDDDDDDEDSDSDEEGVPYELGEDGEIEEEDKSAMFNLVMNEVLRQYREEHGRGPNTQELLDLRATIAKELDVEVAQVTDVDWNKKAKENSKGSKRKIGFLNKDKILEYHPDPAEHDHHDRDDDDADDDYIEDDEHDVEQGGTNGLDGEDEETNEPPKKKLKTVSKEDDDEEDAKPAAMETETKPPSSDTKDAEPSTDDQKQSLESGDTDKR